MSSSNFITSDFSTLNIRQNSTGGGTGGGGGGNTEPQNFDTRLMHGCCKLPPGCYFCTFCLFVATPPEGKLYDLMFFGSQLRTINIY